MTRPMTVTQAAAALGISEVWLRRLIDQGRVAGAVLDGRLAIERSEVERVSRERASKRRPDPVDAAFESEEEVIQAVVDHLGPDWVVEQRIRPDGHEHGTDLVMRLGEDVIAIEAKGFPSRTYHTGPRAGQAKRWRHPAARSYMGGVLLEVLL